MKQGWILLFFLILTGSVFAYAAVHIDDQNIILGGGAVVLTGASNGTLLVNGQQVMGSEGPPGPQGPIGETGPEGQQGVKGDTGETGAQGLQGIQGIQGIQGDPGPKGDTGDAGPQGLQGFNGTQGIQGIQGDQGEPGADGSKWYDGSGVPPEGLGVDGDYYLNEETGLVYVKDTVWQLTANIKGAEGDQGIQGIQGILGEDGAPGAKGDTGDQGIQGPIGYNGTQGIQGEPGQQGDPGVKGDTGETGPKGDKGDTGEQGPAGYSPPDYMQYNLIRNYPYGGAPTTLTPTTHSATVARVFPFNLDHNITVNVIRIQTATALASCLILGIFDSAGAQVWQSGVLSTTNNVLSVTANLPVTLTAGTYYFTTTNNNVASTTTAYRVTPAVGSVSYPRWGTVPTTAGAMPSSITPTAITETTGGWMCYVQLSYVTT